MASNAFGQLFRVTTFGESHGKGIGVVIDGCPAGLALDLEQLAQEMMLRRPGKTPYTSPRQERDEVEILSGLFEGRTTGAPLTLWVANHDVDTSSYEPLKKLYRPGHAQFTYQQKYGLVDYRGGGRASARETAARVAAGAVAKQLLALWEIRCTAFLVELGGIRAPFPALMDLEGLQWARAQSALYCPCAVTTDRMQTCLDKIRQEGDSVGGIVGCIAHVPSGLGEPVYAKLEALLAFAMLSIPASKGFEIGEGFSSARMRGSEHNDPFTSDAAGNISLLTHRAGGTLGGISTGGPLWFQVPFKPTSSVKKTQATVTLSGEPTHFELAPSARHDPCVAIRAVPVVEAMTALVLADALLMARSSRASFSIETERVLR